MTASASASGHQPGTIARPLVGRTALVTGGGRGIGRALVLQLSEAGASVAVAARSRDQLEEVARAVRAQGGTALVVVADLAEPGASALLAARAADGLGGRIDVLINNAAVVSPMGPTLDVDERAFAEAFQINVVAVAALSAAAAKGMVARGWGRIVNVSSGVVARPAGMLGGNAYVATKAALEAHTQNLAAELAGSGVTVNAFRPGGVDTAMQRWIRSEDPALEGSVLRERFEQSYAEGRLLSPAQSAASLVRRIPSDETGKLWDVADAQ